MAIGTLPAAPYGIGSEEDSKTEYFDALNKTLAALDARSKQGPNWFNVGAAFLDPGRTGSFGEAVGKVGAVLGAQQEKEQDMALPIAQMRAQLAGTKYQVEQEANAMSILAKAVGTTPGALEQDLKTGNTAGLANKITPEVYTAVALRSPKVGEVAKTLMEQSTKENQMLIDIAKGNINVNEMRAKYGDDFMEMLPSNVKNILMANTPKPVAPATTVTTPAAPSPVISTTPAAPVDTTAQPTVAPQQNVYNPQITEKPPVIPTVLTQVNTPKTSNTPITKDEISLPHPIDHGVITSPYGSRLDPITKEPSMHNGIDFAPKDGKIGAPVQAVMPGVVVKAGKNGGFGNYVEVQHDDGTTSYYGHLQDINVTPGAHISPGAVIGTLGNSGHSTGPHVELGFKDQNGKPIDPSAYYQKYKQNQTLASADETGAAKSVALEPAKDAFGQPTLVARADNGTASDDLANLPLAEKAKIKGARITDWDNEWKAKRSEILGVSPETVADQNAKVQQTMDIVAQHPNIVGLLRGSGWWSGMQKAAQEGLHGHFLNVSLPIESYKEYASLSPDDQALLKTVTRNLGDIYLSSIRSGGKALGSNPTNFEDRLYKAPMATQEDSAKAILAWGNSHLLHNQAKLALYDAYGDYRNKVGATADPSLFFMDKTSPYRTILNNYSKAYSQLPY
jgi:murein DD-endopeptidase MepM/ murein hydrolase activator NlpD